MRAGQHFDSSPGEHQPRKSTTTPSDSTIGNEDKKDVVEMIPAPEDCKDTSTIALEYQYGDAFYMAEINPSGNVFAVEERPGKSTLARLYSPGGELLNTSELRAPTTIAAAAADDAKESTKAGDGDDGAGNGDKKMGVQTLLISTYRAGCYALVIQGGYALFVDAEKLTITNCFKLVN